MATNTSVQVYPPETRPEETKLQSRLLQKLGGRGNRSPSLGDGALPFTLDFPDLAPNSVLICADESEDPANVASFPSLYSQRTMGVFYDVRVHLAETSDDYVGKKTSTVAMGIRKAQYAMSDTKLRSPASTAEKGFMFGSGETAISSCIKSKMLELKVVFQESWFWRRVWTKRFGSQVVLSSQVYYHGEDLPVHLSINNHSKQAVKNIRCNVNQHCELTMINAQYSCKVVDTTQP